MRTILLVALLATSGFVVADPHTDYLLYCRGCHLANGKGVPPDVPTLHELGKLVASAEGREYIIRVPGVAQTAMNDKELAAVLNWILAEFNEGALPADHNPYDAREIGEARVRVLEDPLKARAAILGN